jgi:LysM repeat protein
MGMIARIAFLLCIVLLGSTTSRAQELREVDGQKYIAHHVLKGQTLYAISKHYAVPVEAITGNNPGSAQNISVGQVLLIPVKAQVKKELKLAPALMNGELAHTVQKKETLFGIARKYGVEPQDLTARNPNVTELKPGTILIIPVARIHHRARCGG